MFFSEKKSTKLLKRIEEGFPGDSLVNETNKPSIVGVDLEDFKLLKMLEKSELITATKYGIEGLPESEKLKHLEVPKITLKGIEFLNGERQKRTNDLILFLTILTVIIGGIQIYLMSK